MTRQTRARKAIDSPTLFSVQCNYFAWKYGACGCEAASTVLLYLGDNAILRTGERWLRWVMGPLVPLTWPATVFFPSQPAPHRLFYYKTLQDAPHPTSEPYDDNRNHSTKMQWVYTHCFRCWRYAHMKSLINLYGEGGLQWGDPCTHAQCG